MSKNTYSYCRDVPIETSYEVVVAGGGPSGVAAAISAARAGAKVLLLEATGALGGMGTNGLVANWYSLSDAQCVLTKGLFWEVLARLQQDGGLLDDIDLRARGAYLPQPSPPEAMTRDDTTTSSG